jgi:DNA-binding response OmpR family regulator
MSVPATILVVEDRKTVANVIGIALSSAGYEVVIARMGEEALGIIHSTVPDMIVMANLVVDYNGVDLIKAIRTIYPSAALPIIMFAKSDYLQTEAIDAGANDYVVTGDPVDHRKLVNTVQRVFRERAGEKTILVVDDELIWRTNMDMALSNRGFKVFCADGVNLAQEIASANPIDLVLIDGLNGEGAHLVIWFKEHSLGGIVVAHSLARQNHNMQQAGCDHVITKELPLCDRLRLISILLS